MITRRKMAIGLGIGVAAIALLGSTAAPKPALRPILTKPSAVLKEGPPASHPHLQWIDMTSLQHGWALNRRDRLLVTWNGGHSWNRTPVIDKSGTTGLVGLWNATRVQGFDALNSQDAWVSTGIHNGFYRTTNGGQTWITVQAPGAGWLDFLNSQRGWLLTFGGVASGQYPSELYTTTDGGIHWRLVASTSAGATPGIVAKPRSDDIPEDLKAGLAFRTVTQGWIAASEPYYMGATPAPALVRTTDGGTTWTSMPLPKEPGTDSPTASPPEFFPSTSPEGLIPVLSNLYTSTAHLRGVQTLAWYQTTDGGKRWIQTGQIIRPIRSGKDGIAEDVFNGDLSFVSASDGWVLWSNQGQRLWHTDNGGRTWTSGIIRTEAHPGVRFTDIDFLTTRNGWAVSVQDQLWTTTDGGEAWTPVGSE
jgi:hypothetical protein